VIERQGGERTCEKVLCFVSFLLPPFAMTDETWWLWGWLIRLDSQVLQLPSL
jgi:hypothetical protein